MLLNVPHDTLALEADEAPEDQLGPNLTRPGHSPRDTRELANLVCSHVADPLDERQVVECEVECTDGESSCGGRARVRVGVQVRRGVLLDEVLESASEVGEESASPSQDTGAALDLRGLTGSIAP